MCRELVRQLGRGGSRGFGRVSRGGIVQGVIGLWDVN